MQAFQTLFTPLNAGTLQLKNRFVIPPMATNLANEDGSISQALIDYWKTRAAGGWGLLIVEFTAIDPGGRVGPCHPVLWDDKYIPGLAQLTTAVHQYGAKIAIQLSHTGRQTMGVILDGMQPVAPSPIPSPLQGEKPRELHPDEIYELVEKFGRAALRAREAGFDAVEIHGAHGYLIAQFMSAYSNKRTDEFGGGLHNRMKFPLEIIRNVRQKVGTTFPLFFRISSEEKVPGGRTIEETCIIAQILEKEGIDIVDVSVGAAGSSQYIIPPAAVAPGFLLSDAGEIKKAISVPVIAVGRINHPWLAEYAIQNGKADLVAWGRASLSDPLLPQKIASAQLEDICPCIACLQGCTRSFPFPDRPLSKLGTTCLVNPFCGREGELLIKPATKTKKIVVVGAGPAGLEAAWISAARGHKVVLFEKQEAPGGQYRIAAIPPFKQDIAGAIRYFVHMCHKYDVLLQMGKEATAENILAEKPDAVIIASGSIPLIPDLPGVKRNEVTTAWEILEGKKQAGKSVLIVGGGMVGCEVADFLGEHQREVTIVEMQSDIAMDVPPSTAYFLRRRLKDYNVQIFTGIKVRGFIESGVLVVPKGGITSISGFDTTVLAMGSKAVRVLEEELKGKIAEIYVIGDALKPRKAMDAIEEGALLALRV